MAAGGEAVRRGVALEAVDQPSLLAAADGEQGAQDAAQLDQAQQRHDDRGDPRQVGQRPDARPGRAGAARCRRRARTAQSTTRCSLRTGGEPAAVAALLRRHLEGGAAGADDAAQRPRVDLHRQQLVVGGLADLHVAAGQRRRRRRLSVTEGSQSAARATTLIFIGSSPVHSTRPSVASSSSRIGGAR